jgi:hypothetical protein
MAGMDACCEPENNRSTASTLTGTDVPRIMGGSNEIQETETEHASTKPFPDEPLIAACAAASAMRHACWPC